MAKKDAFAVMDVCELHGNFLPMIQLDSGRFRA